MNLDPLHKAHVILGKLGIQSAFTIYVMLAVTNSKHKLHPYVAMACICLVGFLCARSLYINYSIE